MAQRRSPAPFLNAGFEDEYADTVNAASQTSRDSDEANKDNRGQIFRLNTNTTTWYSRTRARTRYTMWKLWSRGWTAEVCAFIFSALSLGGLVTTLLAHQDKPQPNWPQLITINSVVSLFSLLMRTGVSVILAEGEPHSYRSWYR
jgi:hypothetical protein